MKLLKSFVFIAAIGVSSLSYAAAPTDESIEKLLTATQSEKMIDQVYSQMDEYYKAGVSKGMGGDEMTPLQKKRVDVIGVRLMSFMKENYSWETIKGDVIKIYRDQFSQEEVDGMVAFYESPVGKSVAGKLPQVMEKSMALSMERMADIQPKLMAALQEENERFDAENHDAIEAELKALTEDAGQAEEKAAPSKTSGTNRSQTTKKK